ncbi:MAG: cyclic nucleotide-binding domain-containing protein [Bacteriovoracaceae bacterium]|nr:cyclic nucleotide-binding domain-containing protein [Bacteriovoracaceae bacterium]
MINLDLFQGIRFFEAFPKEQLEEILPLTERKSFKDQETILKQGQLNLDLFFLLTGAVDIKIDGQYVASLSSHGQVFGEMSIANHTTCTATVTAKGETTMMMLNFEELKQSLSNEKRDGVLKNFYQATAEILARKLVSTNQLAKTYRAEHGA